MKPARAGLWLLGLASSAGFLAAAGSRLDWGHVGAALAGARLLPWLPLGIAAYLAGHALRGFRLRALIGSESPLPAVTAANVVVVGYAANNVLPARLGELARAWMLAEKAGLPFAESLAVTLLERLLDGLVLVLLFGLTVPFLPSGPMVEVGAGVAAVVLAIALAGLATGIAFPRFVLATASRVAGAVSSRHHDRLLRPVEAALRALALLAAPRTALAVALWSVAVWLAEACLFLALLPAFGLAARPATAMLAMTTTNLGILLPSTPGYVGPFHYFCMQAVASTGAPREVAFGYAVLVHAAFFVPVTLWGIGVVAAHGMSLGRAVALSREARPAASLGARAGSGIAREETDPAPSRFMVALVEAAVPLDEDGVTGAARTETARHVAGFVAGQLAMLPVRLRLALAIGMWGFRAATRLLHLRGFCELPPALRTRWFERWAYGPAPLARQLFRAVRATALLSYYETPAARAALARHAAAEKGGPLGAR